MDLKNNRFKIRLFFKKIWTRNPNARVVIEDNYDMTNNKTIEYKIL